MLQDLVGISWDGKGGGGRGGEWLRYSCTICLQDAADPRPVLSVMSRILGLVSYHPNRNL